MKVGMIAVLHTWGQNLRLHPHLHCIVPGCGIDHSGKWQNLRTDGKYLFPVKALSIVLRPYDPSKYPCCGNHTMVTNETLSVRGPQRTSFHTALPFEMSEQCANV